MYLVLGYKKLGIKQNHSRSEDKCCELGTKLAKHGYTECTWSMKLVRNVNRIDRQWSAKSAVTGARPSHTLLNIRRLSKCKRFKALFNKCCTAEKIANEIFIKWLMLRWSEIKKRLDNKIQSDRGFDAELQRS